MSTNKITIKKVKPMRTVGLITEYNPFHNGHLYHFQQAMEITDATHSIAVMSGNFVQRGEPAIIDKWSRTRMALAAGIDLIIELPFAYAVNSAPNFAKGAVELLNATGIVDYLCFGSEAGTLSLLDSIAKLTHEEPPLFKTALKTELAKGNTFAKAQAAAVASTFKTSSAEYSNIDCDDLETLLSEPNNILGIEYIRALHEIASPIKPITIQRIGTGYNDPLQPGNQIAGATSIRKVFAEEPPDTAITSTRITMPDITIDILKYQFSLGKGPVLLKHFDKIILAFLRRATPEDLKQIYNISEGLENRLKKAALNATSIEALISEVKTKRYTWTRLQRTLIHLLMNFTNLDATIFTHAGGPQYLRVLGFSEKGRNLLSLIKRKTNLPIITRPAQYFKSNMLEPDNSNYAASRMLQLDILSSDLYQLAYTDETLLKAGDDYRTEPINNWQQA
jgi:predicted nucleotidyltransferase